jgi:hypothetical protein
MKIVICPPPFRPTGVRADLSFIIFPPRIFPNADELQRRKQKINRDMFPRPAPVEFEEIEIAGALFGQNTRQYYPANAQADVAVTFAVLVPRVDYAEAHKKENDHVTQKPFVPFVRFNRRFDRLGIRPGRREIRLRCGVVSDGLHATSRGQSPGVRRHGPKPSIGQRHLDNHQLAAMLSGHRIRGYFHSHPE